jgi:dTDP-4-amino-4,6-dideoxygalactose transaminase|tara:strand:- start:588 stop:1739 length:1152 start_codon:yes stop_codon:yes gene_type:complete
MKKSNIYGAKKKRIEFGELQIGDVAKKHLLEVVDSNWASYGSKSIQFEKKWGEIFDYKYNLSTSSGTDAVIQCCLSLYNLGAEIGDEVITPALSFIATSNAIRAAGFTPKFVDIEKETLNIDPSKIEEAITNKTKAIMVVHTMGKPCNMQKICDIAKKYNLTVIEDACESHGAKFQGKYIGKWGDMSCYSFYVAHLICCGEGGMVSTDDESIYETISSTRCHGRSGLYFNHPLFGLNSKMNDLEASLGLEGVENFHETFNIRHNNMMYLHERLSAYKDRAWYSEQDEGDLNCPHGFSVTLKRPGQLEAITKILDEEEIHWKRNFGCIPTQHSAFSYLKHKIGDFPNAEHVGDNGIHLGVHRYLSDKDVQDIGDALAKGLEKCL